MKTQSQLAPITITITDQRTLKRIDRIAQTRRFQSPNRAARVCFMHGLQLFEKILGIKKSPFQPAKKTVSFDLPADEFEVMDYAVRTFYAGAHYCVSSDKGLVKIGLAERACMLLRRDVEQLRNQVTATRINPNVIPLTRAAR